MKKAFLLLTFVWVHTVLCARIHTAVMAERMNIVYIGIPNPLKVVAENISCKALWLSCNNGNIQKRDDCYFEITPDKPGTTVVFVYRIHGRDTLRIDSAKFRTRSIPIPVSMVGGKHGGSMPANVLRAQLGVAANYTEVCGTVNVTGFTIIFLKKAGKWIEISTNTGPYFSAEMKKLLGAIEAGDRICISNIKANGPTEKGIILEPFELIVE